MIIAYVRGHEVFFDEDKDIWLYSDNKEPVPLYNKDTRNCAACNKPPTEKGHDPCLGEISGAINACCGHGVDEGYIQYPDKIIKLSQDIDY